MLNDQELGELVVKIQADDVRPRDLCTFLKAVTTDVEMRKNLKLAGKVLQLERGQREGNCKASILFLVTYTLLAPEKPPKLSPSCATTRAFAEAFNVVTIAAWKEHVRKQVTSPSKNLNSNPRSKVPTRPDLLISFELFDLVKALEDFWDVQGMYLA